jgi:hypothetical protein
MAGEQAASSSVKMHFIAVGCLDVKELPRIESFMHPGLLLTVMVLLGAMSPAAAPQISPEPSPSHPIQVPAPDSIAPLPLDANVFVRQAIKHDVEEQDRDQSFWRYHLHREDEKSNVDRDVIETREGQLSRTLLLWGKPLTVQERQNDEERMQHQVGDPEERARREKREKDDGAKARQMLLLIPDAFIFTYDGQENGLVRLAFVPNPHFDPPNFEAKVYRSLKGFLWIDRESMRLAGIDGTLFEDVNFGWGLLGHLNKGGTFHVRQKNVGEGHWDVVSEDVNMVGRAVIFKTITRKQKQTRTDFQRVPNSMSIREAYQILLRDPIPSGHNQDTSELQIPR